MIGRLRGEVVSKGQTSMLLDVQGVGYEVDVPLTTLCDAPNAGQSVILHTHLVVREDAQLLYGFLQLRERDLFRELIKVSGVGARTALAMLSTFDTNGLVSVILQGDVAMLSKVPGIGKKSAERIIVELKGRLDDFGQTTTAKGAKLINVMPANDEQQAEQDAIAALVALGYKPNDASRAVKKVASDSLSSEAMIRLALKEVVV